METTPAMIYHQYDAITTTSSLLPHFRSLVAIIEHPITIVTHHQPGSNTLNYLLFQHLAKTTRLHQGSGQFSLIRLRDLRGDFTPPFTEHSPMGGE
jgi:hypothetical protein